MEKSLSQKLGIHEGQTITLINEPNNYMELINIPVSITKDSDFIHLFVKNQNELKYYLQKIIGNNIKDKGTLWISWPKKSSNIATNLSDEIVRDITLQTSLVDIKVCSIDSTWSGLKFVPRKS